MSNITAPAPMAFTPPAAPITTGALTFVPWVRQGIAAAIDAPDTHGVDQHAVVDVSVALAVNGRAAPLVSVRLRGPADVLGIDASQVIRVDPRPASTDFEPTFFPSIEFD